MIQSRCVGIKAVWIFLAAILFAQEGGAQSLTYKALGQNHRLVPVPNLYVTGNIGESGLLAPQSIAATIPNVVQARSIGGGMTLVQTSRPIPLRTLRAKKATRDSTAPTFLYPVYRTPGSRLQVYPRPEVVVCIREGADIAEVAERNFLRVIRPLRFTTDQYILGLDASSNPFSVSDQLWNDPDVVWSNPNYARQIQKRFKPNDPLYSQQWHLNNTGQNGAKAGADISAEAAWDLQKPNPNIVIGIVDDSVDLDHPDLNIYTNAAEANGIDGVDDDKNGLIDDVHGWDFGGEDNDPNPETEEDSHGTACAGVAAAIGNNGEGVVGASYGSLILPVRITFEEDESEDPTGIAGEEKIAEAIRYAAKYCDVMNNSWGGSQLSDVVSSALDFATSSQAKRGEKGVPVLFASGNDATWFQKFESAEPLEPGTYTIVMSYEKDASGKGGQDRVLIENAGFVSEESGETIAEIFPQDTNFPEGVSSEGDAPFSIVKSDLAEGGYVYQSGTIGNDQYSDLIWEVEVTESAIFYVNFRISSEAGKDGFSIYLGEEMLEGGINMGEDVPLAEPPYSGEPPANIMPIVGENTHPNVINIGASNDQDVRSLYSQWGPQMDLLAPSNGGINEIVTTDVSKDGFGYDPESAYCSDFGGTSSACPLAVGSFALVMAANPDLTVAELLQVFEQTAVKIGSLPYDAEGFNEQYGYGRINLAAAVKLAIEKRVTAISSWELY